MASSPITLWEIDGETSETVSDFISLGSKITADGDCKRHLLLGRKVMTNLDSIFKSRDITLRTKVRLVKAMVFPVVMYGCDSWMVKKVEHRRIDASELWCWRRLLRVPWTLSLQGDPTSPFWRRSVLGVLWKDWCFSISIETPILWTPHAKSWLIGKDSDAGRDWGAGGEGDDREWDGWMASLTLWMRLWVNSRSWWWTGKPGMLQSLGLQRVGHDWVTELNWPNKQRSV